LIDFIILHYAIDANILPCRAADYLRRCRHDIFAAMPFFASVPPPLQTRR